VNESVILVDTNDNEIGTMQKVEAHLLGRLHRAFSVFIFNSKGELLLQQRAVDKYHSGGKWTNTCCSHPREGEKTLAAAHRRLKEEMGMECHLYYVFNFTYNIQIEQGLYEHELDHVYFGSCDVPPVPNPAEVLSFKYMAMNILEEQIESNPELYTEWLKICFQLVKNSYKNIFVP
jgi:isopentenyl-diphosphate Delta-isomerase